MITAGAALEHGFEFKRPCLLDPTPPWVRIHHGRRILKIGLVVRPKQESGTQAHPSSDGIKEAGLKNPVLVMAELGPGIGKKDKNVRKACFRGKRLEKETGFRLDEVQVGQPGPITLPNRSRNAIRGQVDANAELFGMGLRVRRQKMPMAAANFPDEGVFSGGKNRFKRGLQRFASLRETLVMFCRAGGIVHGRTARHLAADAQACRTAILNG